MSLFGLLIVLAIVALFVGLFTALKWLLIVAAILFVVGVVRAVFFNSNRQI